MRYGTLETVDGRPALRFERRLNHPVERVWRAVTEPGELACWFLTAVEWTPEKGETFEAEGEMGEIIELDPPNLITYVWGGERLRFELEPVAGGCLLVFEHVFDDRALGAQHAAGWDRYLDRLVAHVAGKPLPAAGSGAEAELHERYAARFGLDPEVGRRTIAAMQSQEDSP